MGGNSLSKVRGIAGHDRAKSQKNSHSMSGYLITKSIHQW